MRGLFLFNFGKSSIMDVANINSVREGVLRIANKQQKGAITDIDINRFAAMAQQDVVNDLYDLRNNLYKERLKFLARIGGVTDIQDINDMLSPLEVIDYAMPSLTTTTFEIPSDYQTFLSLSLDGQPCELSTNAEYKFALRSSLMAPTAFNIMARKLDANRIEVSLASVSDSLLTYYKIPQGVDSAGNKTALAPTWASVLVGTTQVYDAANSINFELSAKAENLLIYKILLYLGINLNHNELLQFLNVEFEKEQIKKHNIKY